MTKKSKRTQPASTLRKTTFKEKNHGLNRQELVIAQAPIEAIINEYNLIQQKNQNFHDTFGTSSNLKFNSTSKKVKSKDQTC